MVAKKVPGVGRKLVCLYIILLGRSVSGQCYQCLTWTLFLVTSARGWLGLTTPPTPVCISTSRSRVRGKGEEELCWMVASLLASSEWSDGGVYLEDEA